MALNNRISFWIDGVHEMFFVQLYKAFKKITHKNNIPKKVLVIKSLKSISN